MNLRAIKGLICTIFVVLTLLSFLSAGSYTRSDPRLTSIYSGKVSSTYLTGIGWSGFNNELCESGQDFMIYIPPGGCEPTIVRSDLLEDQNVPVFCKLEAIQINPLIKVDSIKSLSFIGGDYPRDVAGVTFHPWRVALGREYDRNRPTTKDIGYAVIILRRNPNESSMPDYVEGNLTFRVFYDVKNAFGIGKNVFYLPAMSDADWLKNYKKYGFWRGMGFLRAEGVHDDSASISVYSDYSVSSFSGSSDKKRKIATVTLKKGETSKMIYLPGFTYCMGGFEIRLDDLVSPDTRARFESDGEVFEVKKGEPFLENRCKVDLMRKYGASQYVRVKCREDDGKTDSFEFSIGPRIKLNITSPSGVTQALDGVSVGSYLFDVEEDGKIKHVYLGYIGLKEGVESEDNLYVRFVKSPRKEDFLDDGSLLEIARYDSANYNSDEKFDSYVSSFVKKLSSWAARAVNYFGKGSAISGPLFVGERSEDDFFGGWKVEVVGFSSPIQKSLPDEVRQYYDSAFQSYDRVIEDYAGEVYPEDSETPLSKIALYNKIRLANDLKQKRTVVELCREFEEKYSESKPDRYSQELFNLNGICRDKYKLSSEGDITRGVLVNGQLRTIQFLGIYEPSKEEYSAEIFLTGNVSSDCFGKRILGKNGVACLSNSDSIRLIELGEDYAVFDISDVKLGFSERMRQEGAGVLFSGKTLKVRLGEEVSFGPDYKYKIRLDEVNLKKMAKVSLNTKIRNDYSTTTFYFRIPIEKRAFKLAPQKIEERIEKLDSLINKLEKISDNLGTTVKAFKASCLATAGYLNLKNFWLDKSGRGIARKMVMRGKGGWYELCAQKIGKGEFSDLDECIFANSKLIDEDVNKLYKIIKEQNERIKELQSKAGFVTDPLGGKKVNMSEFMKKYSKTVSELLEKSKLDFLEEEGFNLEDLESYFSYDRWKNNVYDVEQLRNVELYLRVLNDSSSSDLLKNLAQKELGSSFSKIKTIAEFYKLKESFEKESGLRNVLMLDISRKAKELRVVNHEKLSDSNLYKTFEWEGGISKEDYKDSSILGVTEKVTGERYIIIYNSSTGIVKETLKVIEEEGKKKLVPYNKENPNPFGYYVKKYDSKSYQNKYLNPQVRYYELGEVKGYPAIVPFDLNNGWYAATLAEKLSPSGELKSFSKSARVEIFWLCNVGENGIAEFGKEGYGDDTCQMIDLSNKESRTYFPGLTEDQTFKLVNYAVEAIRQATNQYPAKGHIRISTMGGTFLVKVGPPAVSAPGVECYDFMSPSDCKILFNVCDPVICPSSRCDFGGIYPVKDVIQSGIFGSIFLCLPNRHEGIVVPVCLSGIKAGIDGLLSVEKSYRDCLQESLETGKTMGICDEINSFYFCEFLWRQAAPLTNFIVPRTLSLIFRQNIHGGGEYIGVLDAWTNVQNSLQYFTRYYAENSMSAFKARTTKNLGGELCKAYLSITYPKSSAFFDSLVEPDSPPQFVGHFDEIPYTTVTNPPLSHYKVYYHIYAGKDRGAYYQVYLRGSPESSYYQDTALSRQVGMGYLPAGEYVSDTVDFTAPSGYKELCIIVNGQEECGFKEVSTSFAVNWLKDQYLSKQVAKTDIKTAEECRSGTAALYQTINPDAQLYQHQIVRICSSKNPGIGTDPYANMQGSRWVDVGYCDDPKIRCWLDTYSVKKVINSPDIIGYLTENKTTTLDKVALKDVVEKYEKVLIEEGDYVSDFEGFLKKLEKERDPLKKIELIKEEVDRLFYSNQKAYAYLLMGEAYAELAREAYVKWLGEAGLAKEKVVLGKWVREREISPKIFEFDDGSLFRKNVYFLWNGSEWYWNYGRVDFEDLASPSYATYFMIPVEEIKNDPNKTKLDEEDLFLIRSLVGKDYEEGLKLLIEKAITDVRRKFSLVLLGDANNKEVGKFKIRLKLGNW